MKFEMKRKKIKSLLLMRLLLLRSLPPSWNLSTARLWAALFFRMSALAEALITWSRRCGAASPYL